MKSPVQSTNQQLDKLPDYQRKKLYTYWNELPFSKTIDKDIFFQNQRSKVKSFIIKYIRDGVEDNFSKKHHLSRRHAFSVKEIFEAYKLSSKGEKYSVSNFHFHIKNLVTDGYLREVLKILEGRQYISYYGRTAITFNIFMNNQFSDEMKERMFAPFSNLIKQFHPDVEEGALSNLQDDNFEFLTDYFYRIRLWYKANYQAFYDARIDLLSFLDLLPYYAFFQPRFFDHLKKVGSLINLDEIMSYSHEDIDKEKFNDTQNQKK